MNASFGLKDGLQLLQTVADGSRYENASICEASRACSDRTIIVHRLLIMHKIGNAIDDGKGKG